MHSSDFFMSLPFEVMTRELASLLPLRNRIRLLCRLCKSLAARYTRLDVIGTYRDPVTIYWDRSRGIVLHPGLRDFLRTRRDTGPLIVRVTSPDDVQRSHVPVEDADRDWLRVTTFECDSYAFAKMPSSVSVFTNAVTTLILNWCILQRGHPLDSICNVFPRLQTIQLVSIRRMAWRGYPKDIVPYLNRLFQVFPNVRIYLESLAFPLDAPSALALERIQGIGVLHITGPFACDDAVVQGAVHLMQLARVVKIVPPDERDPCYVRLLEQWLASVPQGAPHPSSTHISYKPASWWPYSPLHPKVATAVTGIRIDFIVRMSPIDAVQLYPPRRLVDFTYIRELYITPRADLERIQLTTLCKRHKLASFVTERSGICMRSSKPFPYAVLRDIDRVLEQRIYRGKPEGNAVSRQHV